MKDRKEIIVEIGGEKVLVIDKLFGPTVACNVRIRHDYENWIVEREKWTCPNGLSSEWEEMCRFDIQESLFGAWPDRPDYGGPCECHP